MTSVMLHVKHQPQNNNSTDRALVIAHSSIHLFLNLVSESTGFGQKEEEGEGKL